jgi:DNA-binding MarR family transcriptional regulator
MNFDKLVHQPTRLRIFAYLYRHGETGFSELTEALDVTEGNLASHIDTMEEADCVTVSKQFVDRKPRTTYELTARGREKFEDHLGTLESLIDGLRDDTE